MKKMVILAAALMMIFPACVRAEDMMSSVTVQGTGSVTVTPDLGTIAFAVTEEGPEAEDVQKAITEKANTVSTALSEAGLPEDHFQTAGIRLYADYDYSSEVEILVGYRGQISMSVEEISVDEVGKYLQILSENGVNQIDGITVFYSGYEDAYREALEKAMLQARKAASIGEVPIGCVIVKDGKIFVRAHNLKLTKSNALMHAEIIAIDKACRKLGDWRLNDMDMYVTLEPCTMCSGAIVQSRIRKVYFGAYEPKSGAVCSCNDIFNVEHGHNHKVEFEGGVMEQECSELMLKFFKEMRERNKEKNS